MAIDLIIAHEAGFPFGHLPTLEDKACLRGNGGIHRDVCTKFALGDVIFHVFNGGIRVPTVEVVFDENLLFHRRSDNSFILRHEFRVLRHGEGMIGSVRGVDLSRVISFNGPAHECLTARGLRGGGGDVVGVLLGVIRVGNGVIFPGAFAGIVGHRRLVLGGEGGVFVDGKGVVRAAVGVGLRLQSLFPLRHLPTGEGPAFFFRSVGDDGVGVPLVLLVRGLRSGILKGAIARVIGDGNLHGDGFPLCGNRRIRVDGEVLITSRGLVHVRGIPCGDLPALKGEAGLRGHFRGDGVFAPLGEGFPRDGIVGTTGEVIGDGDVLLPRRLQGGVLVHGEGGVRLGIEAIFPFGDGPTCEGITLFCRILLNRVVRSLFNRHLIKDGVFVAAVEVVDDGDFFCPLGAQGGVVVNGQFCSGVRIAFGVAGGDFPAFEDVACPFRGLVRDGVFLPFVEGFSVVGVFVAGGCVPTVEVIGDGDLFCPEGG